MPVACCLLRNVSLGGVCTGTGRIGRGWRLSGEGLDSARPRCRADARLRRSVRPGGFRPSGHRPAHASRRVPLPGDSFSVSSWISTATLASASACCRLWWAQNNSSPESGSTTRTYAWAPHRSHRSVAFNGLLGARAPVMSPPSRRATGSLCPVGCALPAMQHSARRVPSRVDAAYAQSERGLAEGWWLPVPFHCSVRVVPASRVCPRRGFTEHPVRAASLPSVRPDPRRPAPRARRTT